MTPRPYQREALRRVLSYAAANPYGRVLLVIPTRGGKTLVGAMLVDAMTLRHGLDALWLVHREELLDEATTHLVEVGISPDEIGVIKAGRSSNPNAKVHVASEATLDRRVKPDAHLVVTDEAHRDTAPRRRRLRRAYPKAFMLGLSATPKPPPQRDLGEDYDSLMVVVQPSELIHDGYIAVPTLYAPERSAIPDLRGTRLIGGDYRSDDLEPILVRRSLLDEQVKEWARLSERRTTIAFPVTIPHSTALVERFQAAGVSARHLGGDTAPEARRTALEDLRAGRLSVISSVGVLSEGTNLPRVKCVLGVRPTRSLTLFIQQSMRCATPWQGVKPRVLDVVGNVYHHGFPFEDRYWSLNNTESGRPIRKMGEMRRCANCGAIMSSGATVCSECTAPLPLPPVPEVPLELREVDPGAAKRAEERERLIAYAAGRGFAKPETWADRVLTAKHGSGAVV